MNYTMPSLISLSLAAFFLISCAKDNEACYDSLYEFHKQYLSPEECTLNITCVFSNRYNVFYCLNGIANGSLYPLSVIPKPVNIIYSPLL